jgi:hypothetical protein
LALPLLLGRQLALCLAAIGRGRPPLGLRGALLRRISSRLRRGGAPELAAHIGTVRRVLNTTT